MTDGTTTWEFTYDANGMRTSRTDGTTTYDYIYNGSSLVQMTVTSESGSDTLYFTSDTVIYNGTTYYYVKNLQGDVTAILNSVGYPVVRYEYNAWGYVLVTADTDDVALALINPIRYRGYVYDEESGLYYLQSRYYDPEIGRFLNADGLVATGQGVLGNNMFAYCRNNPVLRKDAYGTADEEADQDPISKLEALLDEHATVDEYGFTIDLETAAAEWDSCMKEIGIQQAYDYMSSYLCQEYLDIYGEEFLFSNACVSYEIEYHVDAYMCMKGFSGYSRNVTTLIFNKDYLIDHCKVVNISTRDVTNVKQALMFDYRNGIRSKYVGTDKDPYYITTIDILGYDIILR